MNVFLPLYQRAILIVLLGLMPVTLQAQEQGNGRMAMKGAVVDSACSIDTDSVEQTIDLSTSTTLLLQGIGAKPKHFTIRLVDCEIAQAHSPLLMRKFQIVFDGDHRGQQFNLSGKAKGLGLEIHDASGNIIISDQPQPLRDIVAERFTLNYRVRLVRNQYPLTAGNFSAIIRFRLNYF